MCVTIWRDFHIESIDSKLISLCLINDYALIADLHISIYGSAECATLFTRMYKGETSHNLIIIYSIFMRIDNVNSVHMHNSEIFHLYKE